MCLSSIVVAQSNSSTLQLREIMRGEDFVGYLPESHRWSEDGNHIIFSWNPDQDTIRSTYKYSLASDNIVKMLNEELSKLPSTNGKYSKDYSMKVYEKFGDLFLLSISTGSIRQITNTVTRERDPAFSGDESKIVFRKGLNVFAWNISDGSIEQLTDFRKGKKKADKKLNDANEWLEQDQLAHFMILDEREQVKRTREYRNELLEPKRPKEIYLKNDVLNSWTVSPDMEFIIYMLMIPAKEEGTIVPDFVTTSGYTTDLSARSKVGTPQNQYETWIYNRALDSTYQVDVNGIKGIYDKPLYRKEYEKSDSVWIEAYHNPRNVIVHLPIFSEDGKAVMVVRSQDNKDRWIMQLDPSTGELTLLDRQRDEAWIGGPGISGWNFHIRQYRMAQQR